jgi:uncharacterized membrane protein YbhN (UPF0104 family)
VSRRLSITIRLAVLAIVIAGLWFFVRKMDWSKLGEALASASIWPLFVAILLNLVCQWGKAAAWHVMLAPRFHVSTWRLFRYAIAAFAASALAPARAGEVLRVWVLQRRDGVPPADTAAVAVEEKLLDGITMLCLVAPVPWLLPDLPSWVGDSIVLCAGIAVVLFIGLNIAVGRFTGSTSVIGRFIAGMHILRSPRRLSIVFALLALVWIADLGQVMLVLYAVGIKLPIAAGLLVLFTLNLTIMVPSTPAQVGAFEVGALAGLGLLHVEGEPALAFALLYHALQVIPIIIGGLVLEMRLVLGQDPTMARRVPELPH